MYNLKISSITPSTVSNIFNVKDFGAVGNGIADDTLAIQQAVSKALNVKGTVFIPIGKYRITATINCIPVWGTDAGPTLDPNGGTLSRSGCSICGEHRTGTVIWADFANWKTTTVNGVSSVCQYYLPNGTLTPLMESQNSSTTVPVLDKIIFYHAEFMHFSDMWILQKTTSTTPTGIAFSTPYSTQTAHSTFQRLTIELFSYGFWFRFTLYMSFKDILINNCVVGIRLARVDNRFPKNNPPSIASWNSGSTGWFHNVLNFARCTIKGNSSLDSSYAMTPSVTEIAFWGSPMTAVFIACSFENIFRGSAANSNTIAPQGTAGTGIYIEDGVNNGNGKNISIHQFYSEVLERPVYCTDTSSINIEGMYLQGAWNNSSATSAALELNNCSFVSISGNIIIPGAFKYFIKATNNSSVFYEAYSQGYRITNDFYSDSTSKIVKKDYANNITSSQLNSATNAINSNINNINTNINSITTTLNNKVDKSTLGDITTLTTTAKIITGAINEVEAGILATSKITGTTLTYVQSNIGNLSNLLTTSKTLVGAINELKTTLNTLSKSLGITISSIEALNYKDNSQADNNSY